MVALRLCVVAACDAASHRFFKRSHRTGCLSCGTCASVCPTCYCYGVAETVNLDLKGASKTRQLHSCNLIDFAEVAPDNAPLIAAIDRGGIPLDPARCIASGARGSHGPHSAAVWRLMRAALKRLVMQAYGHRLLSMRATESLFRRLRLARH